MLQQSHSMLGDWKVVSVQNRDIRLSFAPEIGGRMIELSFKGKNLLYLNKALRGKRFPREENIGGFSDWKHYGGSVTWLSPQGWSSAAHWHGPPDASLATQIDSGVWTAVFAATPRLAGGLSLILTGPEDHVLGVQLEKAFHLDPEENRIEVTWSIRNPRPKGQLPSQWAIWENSPIDASHPDDPDAWNTELHVEIPRNSGSRYPAGYHVLFGDPDNPQWKGGSAQSHRVTYGYQVGKAAWDCAAGDAVLRAPSNRCFEGVQWRRTFGWDHHAIYPDGNCNFAIWTNGAGRFDIEDQHFACPNNPRQNPPVLEFETMSPMFRLLPQARPQTYRETWRLESFSCFTE